MDYGNIIPSRFVYMPKIGQEITVGIKSIVKNEKAPPQFQFSIGEKIVLPDGRTTKVAKPLGYNYECELEGGKILPITNLSAFINVFRNNNVQEGEYLTIRHKAQGAWECEKLTKEQYDAKVKK